MAWSTGWVTLGVLVLASCDGRLLPGGFPSSTSGAGGAPELVVTASGAGGAPGAGGAAGSSGTPDAGALSCDDLVALYAAAVEQDKDCDPNSKVAQCQLNVIPALCADCPDTTFVNSRAASTAARLRWDAVPCSVPKNCAPVCRPHPNGGRCVPTADGGGHCMDIVVP